MTALPIVDRELRVRARRGSTWAVRASGACVAIVIAGGMLVMSEMVTTPNKFGAGVFNALAVLAFAFALLEGARNTADCLSEEKRAGTLGLLFLTDLRGYEVALGKMAASSLNSFYALLAVLPALALPLLLGGVTAGEFWRLALVLVNTLFLSLTAGLCVSACSREERNAWGAAFGGLILLALLPLLAEVAPVFGPLRPFSPTLGLVLLHDAEYRRGASWFWGNLGLNHGMAWAFLVTASALVTRGWKEPLKTTKEPWARRLRWRLQPGREATDRRRLRDLLAANPVLWLAWRRREQQVYLWALVILAAVGAGSVWRVAQDAETAGITLFAGALLVHLALTLWMASLACSVFAESRDAGLLELLLCTPVHPRQIIQGHAQMLQDVFLRPVATLLTFEAILTVFVLFRLAGWKGLGLAQHLPWIGLLLLAWVVFILDLYAVASFGMWAGLTSRKPGQALTKTILFVLLLPLVGVPCFMLWPFAALVKDLVFINYARDQLHHRFRQVVTERYARPSGPEAAGVTRRGAEPPQLPAVLK